MTIRLANGAEFLHIPKTGGVWVTSVLESNNLLLERVGHDHADFEHSLFHRTYSTRDLVIEITKRAFTKAARPFGYNRPEETRVFRFCFVRHPLSWYESFWKYMNGRGWNTWGEINSRNNWHPNAVLNGLGSDDFNEFVYNVIRTRPGYVTELFFSYAKPGISFIGKTENIKEDLARVLGHMGLKYDEKSLENTPRANVSRTGPEKAAWDPELRKLVMRIELPALIAFDYLTAEDKDELGITRPLPPNEALQKIRV